MLNKELTYHLNEIDSIAEQIVQNLESKVVVFKGQMGTGKTTLIKAIVKTLTTNELVNSPTFSVVNEYQFMNDSINHIDLYRVEKLEDALNFGIEDYIYSDQWCFIEWPEIIETILPERYNEITLDTLNTNTRSLKLTIRTQILT